MQTVGVDWGRERDDWKNRERQGPTPSPKVQMTKQRIQLLLTTLKLQTWKNKSSTAS